MFCRFSREEGPTGGNPVVNSSLSFLDTPGNTAQTNQMNSTQQNKGNVNLWPRKGKAFNLMQQ